VTGGGDHCGRRRPSSSSSVTLVHVLAGLPAPDADLLLLDEPANHLDAAAPALRTARLREWRCGVVTVGHDRAFPTGDATTFVDLDPSRDGRPAGHGGGCPPILGEPSDHLPATLVDELTEAPDRPLRGLRRHRRTRPVARSRCVNAQRTRWWAEGMKRPCPRRVRSRAPGLGVHFGSAAPVIYTEVSD